MKNPCKKECDECNKYISQGLYGIVYESKKNKNIIIKAIKTNKYRDDEYKIGKKAYKLGVGPKIYKKVNTENYTLLFMERVDTPLYKWILKKHTKKEYKTVFNKLIKLVKKLHQNNIIHGDIHIGNIGLIGKKWVLYDYGHAYKLSNKQPLKISGIVRKTMGTPNRSNNDYETYFKNVLKPYKELSNNVKCHIYLLKYIKSMYKSLV